MSQEIHQLLSKLVVSSSTAEIKEITNQLSIRHLSKSSCLHQLTEIIVNDNVNNNIKQLASIELRKKIAIYWDQIQKPIKTQIKASLLQCIASIKSITNQTVCHSIARVISEIATIEMSSNEWPELLPFMFQLLSNQNNMTNAHLEMATYLLYSCFDSIADYCPDQFILIISLLQTTIINESFPVTLNSLQILGKLSELIETNDTTLLQQFKKTLPLMIQVLVNSVSQPASESSKAFQVIDALLLLETPLISNNLAELITLYMSFAQNRAYNDDVRMMALNSIIWCTLYHKSRLLKLNILPTLVHTLFQIISSEQPDDDEEEDTEETPLKTALHLISQLALHIPPTQIFPLIATLIASSSLPSELTTSMLCIGVMVDGCAEYMRSRLDEIISLIVSCLSSTNKRVCESACRALTALTDELQDDMVVHHSKIIPLVTRMMPESRHAVNAVSTLLESGMDKHHATAIMQQFGGMLMSTTQEKMRVSIVGGIGSCARALTSDFQPYFHECMTILLQLVHSSSSQLRSVCIDTIASIAQSVGPKLFAQYHDQSMQIVIQSIALNDSMVSECAFVYFAILAEVYKRDFSVYLQTIVPILMNCLKTEEDDPNVSLESEEKMDSVSTSITHEKQSAAHCLGQLFGSTTSDFIVYVDETLALLVECCDHYNEQVRGSAASSLLEYVQTMYELSNPMQWKQGIPVVVPVQDVVLRLIETVMQTVTTVLSEEFDKHTFLNVMQDLRCTMKLCGPALLECCYDDLLQIFKTVLEKKHVCQEDADGDEMAEYDALVVGSAMDCVVSCAELVGEGFIPAFKVFLGLIINYYDGEESMCCGALAECCKGLGGAITEFSETLMEVFVRGIQSNDDEVKSNCAYGLGVLFEVTHKDMSAQCLTVLQLLHPLFSSTSDIKNMTDNACGAVSRILLKYPSVLPLDQVFGILLQHLPLRSDFEEYGVCVEALRYGIGCGAIRGNMKEQVGQLLRVIESDVSEEVRVSMMKVCYVF